MISQEEVDPPDEESRLLDQNGEADNGEPDQESLLDDRCVLNTTGYYPLCLVFCGGEASSSQRKLIMKKFRAAGLQFGKQVNYKKEVLVPMRASYEHMEKEAASISMVVPVRPDSTYSHLNEMPYHPHLHDEYLRSERGNLMLGSGREQYLCYRIVNRVADELIEDRRNKVLKDIFAVHHMEELKKIRKQSYGAIYKQPYTSIGAYFGEKFGIYYRFLDFYTLSLVIPAVVGVMVFGVQFFRGSDHPILLLWSLFMMFYAHIFLKRWRMVASQCRLAWGLDDFREDEHRRIQFLLKSSPVLSPISGELEPHYPKWKRRAVQLLVVMPVIVICILVNALVVYSLMRLRLVVAEHHVAFGFGGDLLNAVTILVMNAIYLKVAVILTNMEVHEYQFDYDNNLIAKVFVLQFFNVYSSLFYTAFVKGRFSVFGFYEECTITDGSPNCLYDVSTQLITLFVSMIFVSNLIEVVLPFLKRLLVICYQKFVKRNELPPLVREYKCPVIDDGGLPATFSDFNELVVQFGFLTMFSAAFALGPLMALINNVVEVRVDSVKLFQAFRRPNTLRAPHLGTWRTLLEVFSYLSTFVNLLLLTFTSRRGISQILEWFFGPEKGMERNLIALAILEHVILFVVLLFKHFYPEEYSQDFVARKKKQYTMNKIYRERAQEDLQLVLEGREQANLSRQHSDVGVGRLGKVFSKAKAFGSGQKAHQKDLSKGIDTVGVSLLGDSADAAMAEATKPSHEKS